MTPRRALLAASILAAALFLWLGRGLTFHADEWEWLLATVDVRPEIFFESYNGHLIVPSIVLFSIVPPVFGMDDYVVLQVASIAAQLACAWLVFALARRRVGDAVGAIATLPVLFLGVSSDVMPVTAWNVGTLFATAAGLGALLLLERETLRGDIGAAALLGLAMLSHGSGLAFMCAALVELAMSPQRRKRVLLMGLPLLPYFAWLAEYGESTTASAGFGDRLLFALHLAASGLAGLLGVQLASPRVQDVPGAVTAANLAAAAAGVLVIVLLVRAGSRPSPRLAGLLAGAGFFWATVTLARTGEADPYSTRYVYLGAVLILLIGVELIQGVRISPGLRRGLAAGAVVCSTLGVVWLAVGASERRDDARILRAELGALELAGDRADPLFRPDTDIRAGFLTTLPYLLAVDKYDESPGDSPQELAGRSEAERREADRVLVQATGLSLRPAGTARPAAAPPRVDGAAGGQVRRRRGCLELRPRGALGAIDLTLPPGGVRLAAGRAGATVQVRRFADGYGIEPAGTLSRAPVLLGPPADRAPAPWHARVASGDTITACALGR